MMSQTTRFFAILVLLGCVLPGFAYAKEQGVTVAAAANEDPDMKKVGRRRCEKGGTIKKPGFRLTFHDEFDGDELNVNLWNLGRGKYEGGLRKSIHKEIHPYELKNGILKLRIEKRKKTNATTHRSFRSGKFVTYTAPAIATWNKFSQAYGWFEVRCKMPKALGIWEGFWLYYDYDQGTPDFAEIDIFESLTKWNDMIHLALHPHRHRYRKGVENYASGCIRVPRLSDEFHVYALNWEPDKLTYYVDGKPVGEYSGQGVPSAPLYIIVSCRTGGWAGKEVDEDALPDSFQVDYVRVYQKE